MDSIIIIGINNGLTMDAVMTMTVGQVVDFGIERYNTEHRAEKKAEKPQRRRATQADFDAFFG